MLDLFADCADRAERLRRARHADGPGHRLRADLLRRRVRPGRGRLRAARGPVRRPGHVRDVPRAAEKAERLLRRDGDRRPRAVRRPRSPTRRAPGRTWTGRRSTSSRWTPTATAHNADGYREELRAHHAQGKPVVARSSAAAPTGAPPTRGGTGWTIVDHGATRRARRRLRARRGRAGHVPARAAGDLRGGGRGQRLLVHLRRLQPAAPARATRAATSTWPPTASSRCWRTATGAYPDMGWEPKESFHALAAAYAG